jgi:CO/xanthine dehydrogenase Mo-binding subunit
MERLLDLAAELGIGPVEIRRRNQSCPMPFLTSTRSSTGPLLR